MTEMNQGIGASETRMVTPGVVLGGVVAGVVLVFWPYGLDQFDLPKWLVLVLSVPVSAAYVCVRAGQDRRSRLMGVDGPLVVIVVAYSTWSIVAPLWGAQNLLLHMMGAGKVLLLAALFGVTAMMGSVDSREMRRFSILVGFSVVVVAVLALAQSAAIGPMRLLLDLSSSRPGRWQVLTTLGNPTWTAEVIAVSFPFVMGVSVFDRTNPRLFRWLRACLALLLTAGIAVTGSRGGILALGVGAAAYWLFNQRIPVVPKNVLKAGLLGLALSGVGLVFAWTAGAGRLTEVAPITGRLALWAAGMNVLKDAPMTGCGLGHSVLVLPEGLKTVSAAVEPDLHHRLPTLLVDRLDNDWLQIAVEGGGPAGLLLFVLWFRAVLLAGRRARREGSSVDAAICASLLGVGWCAVISAPLHTPATAALFWLLIGLAATRRVDSGVEATATGGRRWLRIVAAAACGIAAVIGSAWALRLQKANTLAGEGHMLLMSGQPEEAAERFRTPLKTMPWLTAVSIDLARALVDSGQAAEALVVVDDGKRWAASEWFWAVEAQALFQLGLSDQAQGVLVEALIILPHSPVLLEAQARLSHNISAAGGEVLAPTPHL